MSSVCGAIALAGATRANALPKAPVPEKSTSAADLKSQPRTEKVDL